MLFFLETSVWECKQPCIPLMCGNWAFGSVRFMCSSDSCTASRGVLFQHVCVCCSSEAKITHYTPVVLHVHCWPALLFYLLFAGYVSICRVALFQQNTLHYTHAYAYILTCYIDVDHAPKQKSLHQDTSQNDHGMSITEISSDITALSLACLLSFSWPVLIVKIYCSNVSMLTCYFGCFTSYTYT